MLYIQNRYDHNGNKIEDITACRLKYEDELIEFLNEIYAGQHNESSENTDCQNQQAKKVNNNDKARVYHFSIDTCCAFSVNKNSIGVYKINLKLVTAQ